jgi:hypothetical protein
MFIICEYNCTHDKELSYDLKVPGSILHRNLAQTSDVGTTAYPRHYKILRYLTGCSS